MLAPVAPGDISLRPLLVGKLKEPRSPRGGNGRPSMEATGHPHIYTEPDLADPVDVLLWGVRALRVWLWVCAQVSASEPVSSSVNSVTLTPQSSQEN